jgi:hypothetical protein
LGGALKGIL